MRGSLPGERRGGRQKGVPNKATQALAAKVAASGLTPLDYMLSVMRDDSNDMPVRVDAAKAAAPYIHPKLANIEVGNKNGEPFKVLLASADGGLL